MKCIIRVSPPVQQCYPQHAGSPGVISLLLRVLLPRELGSLKTGRFPGDLPRVQRFISLPPCISHFLSCGV